METIHTSPRNVVPYPKLQSYSSGSERKPQETEPNQICSNLRELSRRQGEPFEKHSNWMSPDKTGRPGWQASRELSNYCTLSFPSICVYLIRAAVTLILQWTRCLASKTVSVSLKRQLGKWLNSYTCAQAIVFNLSISKNDALIYIIVYIHNNIVKSG